MIASPAPSTPFATQTRTTTSNAPSTSSARRPPKARTSSSCRLANSGCDLTLRYRALDLAEDIPGGPIVEVEERIGTIRHPRRRRVAGEEEMLANSAVLAGPETFGRYRKTHLWDRRSSCTSWEKSCRSSKRRWGGSGSRLLRRLVPRGRPHPRREGSTDPLYPVQRPRRLGPGAPAPGRPHDARRPLHRRRQRQPRLRRRRQPPRRRLPGTQLHRGRHRRRPRARGGDGRRCDRRRGGSWTGPAARNS